MITFNDLNQIANKFGKFDLQDYFNKSGNNYAIFIINYQNKEFIFSDGTYNEEITKAFKSEFNFSHTNISALYAQLKFNETFETIMINEDLLISKDNELFELVIFHEICHLLEKTEYYKELKLSFSDEDIKIGKKLESIANRVNEMTGGWGDDYDHNETFGCILFYFIRKYNYDNRFNLLGKSMIKNFLEDYSLEFKKEFEADK